MNLEELRNEWSKDCEIDDIELDKSSLEVPKLHAKYQEFLTDNILILKNLEFQYNTLLKNKWLWYNGKMSEEQIKELGWEDDPFDGLKVMKNDMQIWYNADQDLQRMSGKVELACVGVCVCVYFFFVPIPKFTNSDPI